MLLEKESHSAAEEFLRSYFDQPELKLPEIHFCHGRVFDFFARRFGITALTFRTTIFVESSAFRNSNFAGRRISGALLVHEAVHILQYQQKGTVRFLLEYLHEFLRGLNNGGIGRNAWRRAYLEIPSESIARAAEHSYTTARTI
jgi:hypothetical protein